MSASATFSSIVLSAGEHFRLHALATALHVIDAAGQMLGSHEQLLEQFPFVGGYWEEADALGALPTDGTRFDWSTELGEWARSRTAHLPIAAMAEAADLDFTALSLLMAVGLLEEDGRLGSLFEALQATPGQTRPTFGLLNAWWREPCGPGGVPQRLRQLNELGLLEVANPDAPRHQWALHVPIAVWDALRGELVAAPSPFLRHLEAGAASACEPPLLAAETQTALERVQQLARRKQVDAILLRGPHHNGRRTTLRFLAQSLGRGVLEVELSGKADVDSRRLRLAAPLCTLLHAVPLLLLDPAPGEVFDVPRLLGCDAPVGIVLGRSGAVRGDALERSVTLELELPSPATRQQHLASCLAHPAPELAALSAQFRLTSGNLRRAARLAETRAALAGRSAIEAADLREAARALGRPALDTLASRLDDAGDWSHFAAAADTLRELRTLENRCRHRESLRDNLGEALARSLNPGVRALFQGPSGTGKTLAARLLGTSLHKDVYRVDLSAMVNKYIGETEKNLARAFAVAEELDVILLFDEGDALLTRRTAVSNSNDRYANLETNFLLQRIESFEGIVIVTTNAGELIDSAFQRRMDVLVDFRPPEPAERWSLWLMHLPAAHRVDAGLLRDISARCQLTGGQIKNTVLHAALLALDDGGVLHSEHLEGALQREYRRSGGVYPLRISAVAVGRA
jgi:predicted nucleic acid-binding protein